MRLLYCAGLANFGDCLNPYLWDRLLPGMLDEDPRVLLLGIGTVLSDRLPRRPLKLVLGSGVGYGRPPRLDPNWHLLCVRGPLTAAALRADAATAVTDPGLLVRLFATPEATAARRPAFMPHYLSARYADWRTVAQAAGLDYIDPAAPVEEVIAALGRASLVVTEALHGAVVADALRVPWVAVQGYRHICRFKWMDWCASLDLAYRPLPLQPLWDAARYADGMLALKLRLKAGLAERGMSLPWGSPARPLRSGPEAVARAVEILRGAAAGADAQLSAERDTARAQDRLEQAVARARRIIAAGAQGVRGEVVQKAAGRAWGI